MLSETIELKEGKKAFFASDFHLGAPDRQSSLEREKKITRWLDGIRDEAQVIFLLGDLFDFWYEFGHVIPKGFSRLQGKLAELSDSGIQIVIFPGNHDLWMFDYFRDEMGIEIIRKPVSIQINGIRIYMAHGDGLGPGDFAYKLLSTCIFRNKLLQFLYKWLIPNFGMWIGMKWSQASFDKKGTTDKKFYGNREWLIRYSQKLEQTRHHDYYIYGHRHLAYKLPAGENSQCLNLGEWISECDYAVMEGREVNLFKFKG